MKKRLAWILPMLLVACATPTVEVSQEMPADACGTECSSGAAGGGGGCCSDMGAAKSEASKAAAGAASGGCCMDGGVAKPAPVKTNN